MLTPHTWHGGPKRLIVYFVLLLLLPAAAVVWLGVRLIDQDRALESRQLEERRESAAERVIAGLEQAVSATERHMVGSPDRLPLEPDDDAVLVFFRDSGIEVIPKNQLLYYPDTSDEEDGKSAELAAAEQLEVHDRDYEKAAASFRSLGRSSAANVRAVALVGLARNLRRLGRADEAMRAYGDLARLDSVRVDGVPADLAGRRARCAMLRELGREAELRTEARSLQADLFAARWRLDRGTLIQYTGEIESWLGTKLPLPSDRATLAEAVDWLWRHQNEILGPETPATGRQLLKFDTPVAVLWQSSSREGDGLTALVAGPRFQQREWFEQPQNQAASRGIKLALVADGAAVLGEMPADSSSVLNRSPAQTGLPWTILVSDANPKEDLDGFAYRRRLLFAGLAILIGLVIAGGYFILRAISRELGVAQLQADFVSAVSHEFRTPLTSLRQFTDLLNESDETSAEERRMFYQAQARATQRLHRLVESLLDFGRIEAGARRYRRQPMSPPQLVRGVVQDFQQEACAKDFHIESKIEENCGVVHADEEALSHALWNLLDNAVKYSGDSRTIGVVVAPENGSVAISVRDRGLGIPQHEQKEIYRKFVRGSEARMRGIKGTGIGLAMVQHIVRDHGGLMRLESTPGSGSTFTMLLPRKD